MFVLILYVSYFCLVDVRLKQDTLRLVPLETILRKAIEGYLKSYDNIIFDKIGFKQSIFVSDRTTNMQFSKMQNKI